MKCRLGVDHLDSDDFFAGFIDTVNCPLISVHARIALLNGISPAQNRSIPPLNYTRAFTVMQQRPEIAYSLNGGISSLEEVTEIMAREDTGSLIGCMLGRAVMNNPILLYDADRAIYQKHANPATAFSRRTILEGYRDFLHDIPEDTTTSVFIALKPVIGFFFNQPGNRKWRNLIDILARDLDIRREGGPAGVIDEALSQFPHQDLLDLVIDKNMQ